MPASSSPDGKVHLGAGLRRWLPVLVAVPIATLSGYTAAANVLADDYPTLVLRFAPHDEVARMRLVDLQLAVGGIAQKARPGWAASARTALRRAPIDPAALRTLGLVAETEGDSKKAKRLMTLAETVSRRDLPTEVWLTVDAAKREDPHGTMAHIDTALSTGRATAPLVFGILGRILVDPRISKEFARLVKQDRPWLPSFLSYANQNKLDPVLLEDVVVKAGGLPPGPDYHAYETDLVWSLSSNGRPDRAAELLFKLGRADSDLLASGRVSDETLNQDLGPFAWTTSVSPDVSSSFQADHSLFARVAPGSRGMVLQRAFALPAGNYQLSAVAHLLTENAAAAVTVEVACMLRTGRVLLSTYTDVTPQDTVIGNSFTVPSNCPIQLIRFTATGGESQVDSELTLRTISLRKGGLTMSHIMTKQPD